ncbi:MAG: caspase family protein [Clostridiales bacterium]|nr:caspase family protein [Candidatus Blautia equi]
MTAYEEIRAAKAKLEEISLKKNLKAILIGVEEYNEKIARKIPNAVRDVNALTDFLREVWQIPEENIYSFTGYVPGAGMLDKIKGICDSLTEEDHLLIYYAGHGTEIEGHSYLVFSDMDFERGETESEYRGIKLEELNQVMGCCKSKIKVRIFDACNCGESFNKMVVPTPRGIAADQQLAFVRDVLTLKMLEEIMTSGKGWITFCSCAMAESSGEMMQTEDPERHGIFTYYLLKGLKGEARRGEGPMYLEDLKIYLCNTVPYMAEFYTHKQHPQFQCEVQGNITLD